MRRSEACRCVVVILALIALLHPFGAEAQRSSKVARVGYLIPSSEPLNAPMRDAFLEGLRELGYVDGRSVAIDARYADGDVERLPRLAAELVSRGVDVIVTAGDAGIRAAQQATATVPIVFAAAGDPVAAGYVASLARPGGNVTGLSMLGRGLSGKRLQLLKEMHPHGSRAAVLYNPTDVGMALRVADVQSAAQTLGIVLRVHDVRAVSDLELALSAIANERAEYLVTILDSFTLRNRIRIVEFAAANRIPAIYETRQFVESGGLMSYGPNAADNYRRAATYVDKILKGVNPAELPVEQASKFFLALNLKTAKALGLTVPQSILARADEVIE